MLVEAVVHVHDRLQYLDRALQSLSDAAHPSVTITVSCNSSVPDVVERAAAIARARGYAFRHCLLEPPAEHLHHSAVKSDAEFVILLHDDDYVRPGYLKEIIDVLAAKPDAAAVSVEPSFWMSGAIRSARFPGRTPYRLSPLFLILAYLSGRCGPAFPSICYRTTFARELFGRPLSFGKYTDVDIVLEFTRRGLWMSPKPLFVYCHHGANDSAREVPPDRARLTSFLRSELMASMFRRDSYAFFRANVRALLGRVLKVSHADG